MALLNDQLSLWEISFRWAGLDPNRLWLRIPLSTKDNLRTLLDAILRMHLGCLTLSIEKWTPESQVPPEFFIRHYLDDAYACIAGERFPRKLLRWAVIDRWDLYLWCQRQGVPVPEFWFPAGWKLAYEWPEQPQLYDLNGVPTKPSGDFVADVAPVVNVAPATNPLAEPEPAADRSRGSEGKLRQNQLAKVACQVVAANLWKAAPEATIASMVKHEAIQRLCGGSYYDEDTVRTWIKVVAPDAVRQKRGRPRKETPLDDE